MTDGGCCGPGLMRYRTRRQSRPSELKRLRRVTVPEFWVSGLLQATVVPFGLPVRSSRTILRTIPISLPVSLIVVRKVRPYWAEASIGQSEADIIAIVPEQTTKRSARCAIELGVVRSNFVTWSGDIVLSRASAPH